METQPYREDDSVILTGMTDADVRMIHWIITGKEADSAVRTLSGPSYETEVRNS